MWSILVGVGVMNGGCVQGHRLDCDLHCRHRFMVMITGCAWSVW